MANGDQFLAQGILQAGQAIGQGLQNRAALLQQRKEQQQKLLQDKFNQFQKQRDSLLKVAGNESFPESVRQRSLNLANQFSSAIGQPLIGSEGEFGQAEKDFSKATATLIDLVEREKLPREQFNLLLREFRQAAVNQSQTPAERENIQQFFAGAQEQVFGKGTPQQVGTGLTQQLVRLTPTNQAIPITQQTQASIQRPQPQISPTGLPQPSLVGTPSPVKVTNKELLNTLTSIRKDFLKSDTVKDIQNIFTQTDRVRVLARNNPEGASGIMNTIVARLFEKGRLSDDDVRRSNIDQSIKQKLLGFFENIRAGRKSTLSAENLLTLTQILQTKSRQQLNEQLEGIVISNRPILQNTELGEQELKTFFAGPLLSRIGQKRFKNPQDIKEAFQNGEIVIGEAEFLLKELFNFGD